MLSPDVEEDLFNTFVIAIVVPCVIGLRSLVFLELLELINCLFLASKIATSLEVASQSHSSATLTFFSKLITLPLIVA